MVLGYFDADFNRTSSPFNPSNSKLISSVASTNGNPGVNLYNGNISSWTLKEDTVNGNYAGHLGFKYRYDQLNRIKKEDYNYYTSSWQTSTDLDNNYTFDGNGNILTLKRQGTSNTMDDLTATYISGTNKLNYVSDAAGSGLYSTDIDNQSTGNYKYTAIGERAKDVEGGIDTITWTMYGKIKAIKKHNGDSLSFTYNASNQRVMKYVKPSGQNPTVTYYINDVQGNIMSNYTRTTSGINYVYTQTEVPIYGSKRIGIYKPNVITSTVKSDGTQYSCISCALNFYTVDLNKQQGKYTRALTKKEYELNDHLGNVHVTLRDRKLSTGQADLISYTNYYAYGTPLTGKTYSSNTYSAGYNGKYKDDEVFGSTGTFYDYGDRPLDTRGLPILPRPDAKTHEYPFWTPYQYSGNNPILFVDPDGQEVMFPLFGTSNTPIIEVMTKVSLENGVKNTLEVGTKISEAVTKTSETAAKTNELNKPRINQDMLRKGRATETEQLQRLGLEKNTKPSTVTDSKTGEDVTTIPDAVRPNGQTVEIKDVIKQSLTKQLRAQEKLSNGAGQKPQLYLPEGAKTSRPLENSTFDIQRFSPNTAPADNTKVATPNPDIPVSTPVAPSCPTCS